MAKLTPDRGFGPNTVMCDICGRPIASSSPYAREGEKYDYDREANMPHEDSRGKGRHVACHSQKIRVLQAKAEAARNKMTPEEREAAEAELFNNSDSTYDPRTDTVLAPPVPVAPKLVRQVGVQANGPPPNDNPNLDDLKRQEAEYDAKIRADFEAEQAQIQTK